MSTRCVSIHLVWDDVGVHLVWDDMDVHQVCESSRVTICVYWSRERLLPLPANVPVVSGVIRPLCDLPGVSQAPGWVVCPPGV